MAQLETPFDEALQVLAHILAEKHLRQERKIGSTPSTKSEVSPQPCADDNKENTKE